MRSAMVLSAALVALYAHGAQSQPANRVGSTAAAAPLVTLHQGGISTLGSSGARVYAETDRDAYLTVFALSDGEMRLLYPRTPRAASRVRAGQRVSVTVPALQTLGLNAYGQDIEVVAIASPVPFDFAAYRVGGRWKESRLIGFVGRNADEVVETVADRLIPDPDVHYSYDVATYQALPLAHYGSRQYGYDQCARYGSSWSRYAYDETYYRYGDPYYFGGYPREDFYYVLIPTGSGWYLSTPMYAHGYSRCGGSPIRFTILLPPRRGGSGPGRDRPDTTGVPRDPDDRRLAWDSAGWERAPAGPARARPPQRGTFSGGSSGNPRGKVTRDESTTTDRPAVARTDEATGRPREVERKEPATRERPKYERAPERKSTAQPARAEPRRSAPAAASRPAPQKVKKAD